jgi:beta-aspartyl-dipeptidase (metallo-type)
VGSARPRAGPPSRAGLSIFPRSLSMTPVRTMIQLLRNLDIFAPEPLGVNHLVVAGEQIVWLGPELPDLPGALDVETIDFEGRRAIPGLMDGHVHVTGGGGEAGPESRVPPLGVDDLTGGGITTVVGLLGTDDTTRDTASLLATTRGLVSQGVSAYCLTGGYHFPPVTLTGDVRGDIVHIDRIIGVGEVAISDHRSSQPSLRELLRVAADSHVAGMMAGKAGILHIHLGDGPRGLDMVEEALAKSELPARVFNPTHVNRKRALMEQAIALARNGCTVDLTAFPVADGEDAWSAADGLVRYLDNGAPPEHVTVSSDGGGCLPEFDRHGRVVRMDIGQPHALVGTLKVLLDSGQPLERVLPAFTSNVASILRLPHKGRLGTGQDADLVILDERHGISDVMARGRWFVRDKRSIAAATFKRSGD